MIAPGIESLRNVGALRIGNPVPRGAKTVVVVGVARGGTSMVATVLAKLGLFLGDSAAPPVLEDVRLATAIESKNIGVATQIMREYDARHEVWAFKRPGLIDHLSAMHGLFRNPAYVVIFRDPLAIANRNVLSMKSDTLRSLQYALKQYDLVCKFLAQSGASALLVSNEKALLGPSGFVDQVVDWLGLEATEQQRSAAAAGIVVGDPAYIDASRLHFLGHVDRASTEQVAGWAFIRGDGAPARLEVVIQDRVVTTLIADLPRPDVQKRRGHPTGNCGFRFKFRPEHGVNAGDKVVVRFALGGTELKSTISVLASAPNG